MFFFWYSLTQVVLDKGLLSGLLLLLPQHTTMQHAYMRTHTGEQDYRLKTTSGHTTIFADAIHDH